MPNEELAAYSHEAQVRWLRHFLSQTSSNSDGSITIPADMVRACEEKLRTAYRDLPEEAKQDPRTESVRILRIFIGD